MPGWSFAAIALIGLCTAEPGLSAAQTFQQKPPGGRFDRFVANETPQTKSPDLSLWSGTRALNDIARQLSLGSRALDTAGHEREVQFIIDELKKSNATVESQHWTYESDTKIKHALTNVIGRFDPTNPRRVIVGTHYDSIARAYRDNEHPDAPMPGANNSASGVAVLLETARALYASLLRPSVGIDLVFFDGEEGQHALGAGDSNWFALGSPHFAERMSGLYPKKRPEAAVIFDMVCYRDLKLRAEPFSLRSARRDVQLFWEIGKKLAPSVFLDEIAPSPISDDQVALDAEGVPSFLVIDFDYEPWFNTTQDTIDKCSAASLAAVGRTLFQYLYLK
jgi:Zn-dependent M28 family amino/carboxypeptidase